jgi:hypothetical protein
MLVGELLQAALESVVIRCCFVFIVFFVLQPLLTMFHFVACHSDVLNSPDEHYLRH